MAKIEATETGKVLIGLTHLLVEDCITFDQLLGAAGMVMGLSDLPQNRGPVVPDTPAPPAKQEDQSQRA